MSSSSSTTPSSISGSSKEDRGRNVPRLAQQPEGGPRHSQPNAASPVSTFLSASKKGAESLLSIFTVSSTSSLFWSSSSSSWSSLSPTVNTPAQAPPRPPPSSSVIEASPSPHPIQLTESKKGARRVLNPQDCQQMRQFLPPLQRYSDQMKLVYSTEQHGISIHTLLDSCQAVKGPILIIISTYEGSVFGGFISQPIDPGAVKHYGTGESFLFKRRANHSSIIVYPATLLNEYFVMSNMLAGISMGLDNGSWGLLIDANLLRGESHACCTFGNPQLASTPTFDVDILECWSFKV